MSDDRDRLDDIEQFVERTEGKVYPRRVFLGMCGALGLAPVAATAGAGAGRPERAGAGQLGRRCRARHEERLGRSLSQEIPRPEGRDRRHRPLDQPHPPDGAERQGHVGRHGPQPPHRARDRPGRHAGEDRLFDRRQEQGAARARRRMGHRQLHLCDGADLQHQEVGRRRADHLEGRLGLQEIPRQAGLPARARRRAGSSPDGRRRAVRQDLSHRHEARARHAQEDERARDLLQRHRRRPEHVPQRRGPARPAPQHPRLASEAGHQGRLRLDLERGHFLGRLLDGAQGSDGRKGDLGIHQLDAGSGGPGRAAQDQRLRPDQSGGLQAARRGMERGQSRRSGQLRQDAARRHCVVR